MSLPEGSASPPSTNLGKRPAPRGTAAYPRKRAVAACQVCRARRTKCDNLKPTCSFCLKVGAQCIQTSTDLSSFDPASLKILDRLGELEQLIRSTTNTYPVALPPIADYQPLDVLVTGGKEAIDTPARSQLLPPRVETILSWLKHPRGSEQALLSGVYRLGETTPAVSPQILDIDFNAQPASVLLDRFFQNVHVKNPVLDEVHTRRLISRLFLQGFDDTAQSCLGLLVCALGALSTSFGLDEKITPDSTTYQTAMSYFHASQKRLGPLMMTGRLIDAQCIFLSGVFMMTILNQRSAWRYFVQALACCQNYVTMADTSGEDCPSLSAAEEAIYWSAWKSEIELRESLNPKDFSMADRNTYPLFFPTPPPPSIDSSSMYDGLAKRQNDSWYFYLSEISLRRLSTRIIREISDIGNTSGRRYLMTLESSVADWEDQAEQWTRSLPQVMSLDTPPSDDNICKFILRGHLLDLYEVIYWPFVQAFVRSNIKWSNSSEHLRQLVNKGIQRHAERLLVNRPGFYHRHHGTLGMIGCCTRSACILLLGSRMQRVAGYQGSFGLDFRHEWVGYVDDIVQLNRYWADEVPFLREWADILEHNYSLWGGT